MSTLQDIDPQHGDPASCDAVDLVVVPRAHDIGDGFMVRRALPSAGRRMVGPFIFLDQMGPATLAPGKGIDVRPHPHIGLATVTYLYEGEIMHRDSLGSALPIRPGALNWMTAGSGIAHSERSGADWRAHGGALSGLQLWVALPQAYEETAPAFDHYGAEGLPTVSDRGVEARVIAGAALGAQSPVRTFSDTVFVDFNLAAGANAPIDAAHEERALYIFSGSVEIGGDVFEAGRLVVLKPGLAVKVTATTPARFALVGGETADGPRYIWWNFVSARKERIEQAKADWAAGRFAAVPGETEFIPLPE
ncbi:MAG TPA: pirin family protein [Rhodoblastus sp.]|nr:pirin family protein [Rhodoblastus sp.]